MSKAIGLIASFIAGGVTTGFVGWLAFSTAAAVCALPASTLIGVVSATAAIVAMFVYMNLSSILLEGSFGKYNDYVNSYTQGASSMASIGSLVAVTDGSALSHPSAPQIPLLQLNF